MGSQSVARQGRCRLFGALILAVCTMRVAAVDLPLRWRWSNPTPHGNAVYDMIAKAGFVYQVTDSGQLYSSYDQVLWDPHETGTTNSLRALAFLNDRLIITGAEGTALYADSLSDIRPAVLNPPTTDWLEGVAASSNLLVSVGDNGAVYTSNTGDEWTRQTSGTTNWLTSVTVNPNGLFVAVGQGGYIATSSDGVMWTNQNSLTTSWLNKVRWLGNSFWALGDNGKTLVSLNGVSWQPVGTGATAGLFAAANNGSQYLLAGDSEVRIGEGLPLNWSNELDPNQPAPPPAWTYFAAERVDPFYFLAGRSGMFVSGFTSGNPSKLYWETHSDPVRSWLWDMVRLPDQYVAAGDFATILTSDDGVDWNLELVPDAVTNSIFLGIGGDTNGLVSVGNQGSIIYSPSYLTNVLITNVVDGVETVVTNEVDTIGTIWYAVDPRPTTKDLQGVTVHSGRFVVTGADGTVLTSDNRGTNWTVRTSPTTNFLSSVAADDLGFVATGAGGTILVSADGASWTAIDSNTTNWLYRVRHIANQFMAVGQGGTMLQSANGANWTAVDSGTGVWINDITRAADTNQTWFAVGNQGAVLASLDAIHWTNAGSITQKSLYAANHDDTGQLVVAGVEGAVLRSQLNILTNAIEIVDYSRGANLSSYLFSGATGQRFTLDRSEQFTNWITGEVLEFLDGTGTLLYVTPNATNPPPAEFYRAAQVP